MARLRNPNTPSVLVVVVFIALRKYRKYRWWQRGKISKVSPCSLVSLADTGGGGRIRPWSPSGLSVGLAPSPSWQYVCMYVCITPSPRVPRLGPMCCFLLVTQTVFLLWPAVNAYCTALSKSMRNRVIIWLCDFALQLCSQCFIFVLFLSVCVVLCCIGLSWVFCLSAA